MHDRGELRLRGGRMMGPGLLLALVSIGQLADVYSSVPRRITEATVK
jgi:hypothetical protein